MDRFRFPRRRFFYICSGFQAHCKCLYAWLSNFRIRQNACLPLRGIWNSPSLGIRIYNSRLSARTETWMAYGLKALSVLISIWNRSERRVRPHKGILVTPTYSMCPEKYLHFHFLCEMQLENWQSLVAKIFFSSWKIFISLYVAFQIIWNIFLFVFCFLSISYQFLPYFTCFLKRH